MRESLPDGAGARDTSWRRAHTPSRAGLESSAIETHELTRVFGDLTAVDRLTLGIPQGEIFGLLGPNGAGKTTLMRMLTGLLLPSAGSATVAGCDIVREAAAIKQRIGYMAQLFCLYGDLTIQENLDFFGGLHGLDGVALRERRSWAVAMAGLAGQERRSTAELPLGFKQRLALASAMMHDPPVLFLDEPTSGVDPVSRRAFWDVLDEMSDQGKTVIVSTHHVEEAEHCDRIALMAAGRMIALGTPSTLKGALEHHTIEIESDHVLTALAIAESAAGVSHAALFGRRLHIAVEDPARAFAELPQLFSMRGATIRSMEVVPPTLEDAVMVLIRDAASAER